MTKHTVGPWHAVFSSIPLDYDACWAILSTYPKKPIVQIWGDSDEDEGNARLIAAAPELLEALKYMINVCPPINQVGEEATMRACIAIAKAEGIS